MYNWYKIPTPSEISYQFRKPCFDIESWGGQSAFSSNIMFNCKFHAKILKTGTMWS